MGSNDALAQTEHHPGQSGQAAGQDPDIDADALDVDAGDGRQVAIVGHGPHLLAEARAGQEERDQRRHDQRHRHRHRLARREADDPDRDDLGLVHVELAGLGAGDDEDDVADQQAETDADERDGDRAAAAQGTKQPEMGGDAEEGDGAHGAQGRYQQILAEHDIDDEGGVGSDRQEVAVREVGDALDAEDQRRADGGQGQDRAGDQPVDEQLGQPGDVGLRRKNHGDQNDTLGARQARQRPSICWSAGSLLAEQHIRTCASRESSFDRVNPVSDCAK